MAEVTDELAKYFPLFFLSSMMSVGMVPLYIGLTREKAKEVAMNGHAREGEECLTGTSMSELDSALNLFENSLNPGEKARLDLATYALPSRDDLDAMWADMLASGFHVSRPRARIVDGIPLVSLTLTKGSPVWAALIPLIVPIAIVGLIAFGIVKIEAITKALFPLILATGGLFVIALGLMRQPAARAAEMAAAKYLR